MIYEICQKHNELISLGCRCPKCKHEEELFGEPLPMNTNIASNWKKFSQHLKGFIAND